jgi:hypothetical protein
MNPRLFDSLDEGRGARHAVEMNLKVDAPLAYLAAHGPEDNYAVMDAETALDFRDGDIERVRLR